MKAVNTIPKGDISAWGDLFHHETGCIYSGTANQNSTFQKHGISAGTQIFFDTSYTYIAGQLSCFYDEYLDFVVSDVKKHGYMYLGKLVATYAN